MNQFTFGLDLDKTARDIRPVIVRQGDHNGTSLEITLYDHGSMYTESVSSAYLVMRLPDKVHYYRTGVTYAAGVVNATLDEGYVGAVPGVMKEVYVELHKSDGTILSTQQFTIVVLKSGTTGTELPESFDDEVAAAVAQWLDDHPEATVTLDDGDVTTPKIADGAVTTEKISNDVFSVLDSDDIDGLFT